jgi:hypothetical protein
MDLRHRRYALSHTNLTITWLHGGGFVPSYVVWRLDGWVVFVVEAGQA